jgi:hypothetical protein
MPWFRLDESFHSHPKVMAAGNEAVGLYVRCGTYAAEHLTNGFIREDIAVLYGACDTGSRRNPGTGKPETLAETLVRTKLWRRTRGGWKMPDYLDYNPSKEAVDNERKNAAERQRRRREALLSHRDSRSDNSVSHGAPSRPGFYGGSVGTKSSDRNGHARASPETIEAIIHEIRDTTGTNITPAWAQTVADHILGDRTPARPTAYIRQAIRKEPNPRLRFLPQYPDSP